jgi:hypothetical protein
MSDIIDAHIRRLAFARAQLLEQACEAALQEGSCGVLEVLSLDGNYYAAGPDERVPYGLIGSLTIPNAPTTDDPVTADV